jgi:methionyl-tRNA formyltransferase
MSKASTYIVAGSQPWNKSLFLNKIQNLPGEWYFASTPKELEELIQKKISPRYIFFLHWSAKVPDKIISNYECVCFHMTDVPYGRGGSPLQNLILAGHTETVLTALRMSNELDEGPVYIKKPLSLNGSAQEIYIRAGELSAEIIEWMIVCHPKPVPQVGDPVLFKRRKPNQSEIPIDINNLKQLHDFIRMLDADGYPHAFIRYGIFQFEFTHSSLSDNAVTAHVRITRCA